MTTARHDRRLPFDGSAEQSRRSFLTAIAGSWALAALGPRAVFSAVQTKTDQLASLSLIEASELIRSRKIAAVELTGACLVRIERWNPILNAFITVTGDRALSQAREADAEIRGGKWRGPLHGVPVALKDMIDTAGVRTTAASGVFKDRVPDQDAEVVARLKAAGAVLLGKLNLHEFAYGGTSIPSYFGSVHNPWRPDHIAGGSSGGSAAAVAAGLCFGALGTDTGGSIRLPAAHCGIVGLKATYGHVSTRGVLPLAWSLDHVGPMTRTVADAAMMLRAIGGYDPREPTSVRAPAPDRGKPAGQRVASIRLGVPREYVAGVDPEIGSAFNSAVRVLSSLTAGVQDVSFSSNADDRTMIRAAEAYAFHAEHVARTPDLYQPEVLARIRTGADVTATAYIEARRRMEQSRRETPAVFQRVDLLVMPTTMILPTPIATTTADDAPRIRNIAPFNLMGFPAISVPCGISTGGLPIGLQLVGPAWAEDLLLAVAGAYEKATTWHTAHPPATADRSNDDWSREPA
jgi:aspartyl-tRNA(Asn)/glutamyl-tRNA(Gln) amidotransferase subunit A